MPNPTFDELVRDTAFAGETTTSIADIKSDVSEIKGDVKHIRTQMDRWGGAVAFMAAGLSVAVSLVASMFL